MIILKLYVFSYNEYFQYIFSLNPLPHHYPLTPYPPYPPLAPLARQLQYENPRATSTPMVAKTPASIQTGTLHSTPLQGGGGRATPTLAPAPAPTPAPVPAPAATEQILPNERG